MRHLCWHLEWTGDADGHRAERESIAVRTVEENFAGVEEESDQEWKGSRDGDQGIAAQVEDLRMVQMA